MSTSVVTGSPVHSFIDIVDSLQGLDEKSGLTNLIVQEAERFGMDTFAFEFAGNPGFFANSFPMEWLRIYRSKDLGGYDPLVVRASQRPGSSTWRELHAAKPVTAQEQGVVNLCRDFGWRDGFCVPILEQNGQVSLAVMAGEQVELSPTERMGLEFLVRAAYCRYREFNQIDAEPPSVKISARERDCLTFVAQGLTDAAISDILNISEPTARFHIDNIRRRLGAATRSQAVATAMMHNLIQP